MITKAFIEEVISPYEVRVRVPILDRSVSAGLSTNTENLNIATICTLPNCYVNLQVGDVVFIGFEDNTYYKAVVLGHLCRDAQYTTYADISIGNLVVNESSKLGYNTTIGNVLPEEIHNLIGTRDNLQKQIDELTQRVNSIINSIGLEE